MARSSHCSTQTARPSRGTCGWALLVGVVVAGLTDPRTAFAETNGIKVGNGRLHTSAELETHHVQNPGRMPTADVYDGALVARGKAALEYPSDELRLALDTDLEYWRFLGLSKDGTSELSTLQGGFTGTLTINEQGAVAATVSDTFNRYADGANDTVSKRLLHLTNDLGLALTVKPGGGALVVDAAYSLYYDRYDRTGNAIATPSALDNIQHRPSLKATWKFLPRTALFLEGQGMFTTYPGGSYEGGARNPGSTILFVYLGAVGAVTPKINALLKAGYGDNFSDVRSAFGQAEVTYLMSPQAKLRAGVMRTMVPTSLFQYFDLWRGYAAYDHQVLGSTLLGVKLSYGYQLYGAAVIANPESRRDGVLKADLSVEHRFNEWLAVSAVESLYWRTTNYVSGDANMGYFYNDFFVRIAALY